MLIAFAELDRDGLLSERKGFWLEAFPRLWRNPPAPLALCKGESTVDLRGPLGPGAFAKGLRIRILGGSTPGTETTPGLLPTAPLTSGCPLSLAFDSVPSFGC